MNEPDNNETQRVFETWTHKGVRFLSVELGDSCRVIDEHGNNYGAWLTVESFRKRQRSGEEMTAYSAGARLTVRTN